jgi:hypothetical protein
MIGSIQKNAGFDFAKLVGQMEQQPVAIEDDSDISYLLLRDGSARVCNIYLTQQARLRATVVSRGERYIVRDIVDGCFSGTSVSEITISSSIERIGRRSMANTRFLSLVSFQQPSQVKAISDSAFYNSAIQLVTFPSSLVAIGSDAFSRCDRIQEIVFTSPSSLQHLGERAFSFSGLIRATLPDSLTVLSDGAFSFCPRLIDLRISPTSSLRCIQGRCFANSGLISLSLPPQVEAIDGSALEGFLTVTTEGNPNFTTNGPFLVNESSAMIVRALEIDPITPIPDEIRSLGVGSFSEARNPFEVTFGDKSSVSSIDDRAFAFSAIRRLSLPRSVKSIGDRTFCGCELLSEFIIPANSRLGSIGRYAFASSSISSIRMPFSLTNLGRGAFSRAPKLATVLFDARCQLPQFPPFAFAESGIREVQIPTFIRIIGPSAFCCCNRLSRVTFAPGSRLVAIGENSFSRSSLTKVILPASVEAICDSAFEGSALRKITFEADAKLVKIGQWAFADTSLSSVSAPVALEDIGEFSFAHCPFLVSFSIPEGSRLKIVSSNAFKSSAVASFDISERVESIEGSAIASVGEISVRSGSNFQLSEGLLKSANTIVRGLGSAQAVPPDTEIIGDSAFARLSNLRTIVFATLSVLRVIAPYAFAHSAISAIDIPPSVEFLGDHCFHACTSLGRVNFSADSALRVIFPFSFSESGLRELFLPPNVESVDGSSLTTLHRIVLPPTSQFSLTGPFLLAGRTLVRYISPPNRNPVEVPPFIAKLGPYCFANLRSIPTVFFTDDSSLTEVCAHAFSHSSIKFMAFPPSLAAIAPFSLSGLRMISLGDSRYFMIEKDFVFDRTGRILIAAFSQEQRVTIPARVEVLGKACFAGNRFVREVVFETASRLSAVEDDAFAGSSVVEVEAPLGLQGIGERAFPPGCRIAFGDRELEEGLEDWSEHLRLDAKHKEEEFE